MKNEHGSRMPPWEEIERQYGTITQNRAKNLRTNSTDTERLLWYYLRNKQLGGHKFRRQQPIGKYIVDFVCMPRNLVVELDGGQHFQSNYDRVRTQFLEQAGFRVLRYWNNEVIENTTGVLEDIYECLKEDK